MVEGVKQISVSSAYEKRRRKQLKIDKIVSGKKSSGVYKH